MHDEAGHGRGLIDAMALFGCKGPLWKEIVTNDAWFSNADEMHSFLSKNFKSDPSKKGFLISEHNTADKRKGQEEQKLKAALRLILCLSTLMVKSFKNGRQ